jgi:hypothetical protein
MLRSCWKVSEGRRKEEGGRRKKEEGRRKKEEGRRKKEEGRRERGRIAPFPTKFPDYQFPITNSQLLNSPITDYQFPITNSRLPISDYQY